jgi:peptidoglycan hydrolase-like protein with peptidoglycan-binding domain
MKIILTETQIKKLTMFQPGNEMSLNEIIPIEGINPVKRGDTGEDVRVMQQHLVDRKYSLPRHGVDGRFGPETERAVKSFQKDHKLTVDGVVTGEVLTAMKDTKKVNPNPTKSGGSYEGGAKSNEQAAISDDLIIEIINGTISAGGSKNYTDLFLDSNSDTAVGILHFTKRGLKKLYKEMDTEKYFGKSQDEMIKSIKRYNGDEMKHSDWKKAMTRFLNSPESQTVQNRAATKKFKEGLVTPINKGGWNTPREYAVGMFYLNSYPRCLYQIGPKYNWDAEQMLRAYCQGECSEVSKCRSRCNHINKSYPISANAGGYIYKGC